MTNLNVNLVFWKKKTNLKMFSNVNYLEMQLSLLVAPPTTLVHQSIIIRVMRIAIRVTDSQNKQKKGCIEEKRLTCLKAFPATPTHYFWIYPFFCEKDKNKHM
jgi:hypothetical protein